MRGADDAWISATEAGKATELSRAIKASSPIRTNAAFSERQLALQLVINDHPD
jgi:hypothetical protein